MDKELSKNQQELQLLLHSKNYSELNKLEKEFVLSQYTKDDYILERKVIVNAQTLFENDDVVSPIPLLIPAQKKSILFGQIPLYQTALLVAATILFMILIRPNKLESLKSKEVIKYIVQTDTVEIQKEVIKYDTIFRTIEKPIYINKDIYVQSKPCAEPIKEAPRLLNSSSTIVLPELTQNNIQNKGKSMKDDNLSSLILDY